LSVDSLLRETDFSQGRHTKRDKHFDGNGRSPLPSDVQGHGSESQRDVSNKKLINQKNCLSRLFFADSCICKIPFVDSRLVVSSLLITRTFLCLFINIEIHLQDAD